jgi:hypothetical protein
VDGEKWEEAAMEEEWHADRAHLRCLLRDHPDWSARQLAQQVGRSTSWAKKWRRRLRAAAPDDDGALVSRSRARRRPPASVAPAVVERILAIRDDPPAELGRVPGPEAILYYLHHDRDLRAAGVPLPRSTATVWQVLRRHGRIAARPLRRHEPLALPEPMTEWQLDFKDVTSVPPDPDGKRAHAVETLNCVDCGTSILVEAIVRDDFAEEATLRAVADLLRAHGLPERITIDRDPRFVGGPHTGDFPSPLLRFLACLGVEVAVNPPHRPDLNAYVERYHGSYERECLRVHRPTTLERAREVTAAFRRHYNAERPNQARSCGNRPPLVAFPGLPPRAPVPAEVDAAAWLGLIDGRQYARTVRANGSIVLEHRDYFVGRALAGQRVTVAVAAGDRSVVVRHRGAVVKRLPLRGVTEGSLPFDVFVDVMVEEAGRHARGRPPRAA